MKLKRLVLLICLVLLPVALGVQLYIEEWKISSYDFVSAIVALIVFSIVGGREYFKLGRPT